MSDKPHKEKQQKSSKKSGQFVSRSQARSLAFQVLYSLEFARIKNLDELRSAFISAPRVKVTDAHDSTSSDEYDSDELEIRFAPTIDNVIDSDDDIIEDMLNESVVPAGFAWELVEGVWTNSKELDKTIEHYAKNWRIDRLGKIELTLLRIALFEMLYRPDIPAKVSITEALELTDQFAEFKAKSFINGLLDAVNKAGAEAIPSTKNSDNH